MKDDTISRKDAIDALDKRFDSIPMEQTTEILQLRKDLRELPSAQPETHDKRTESHACDLIDRRAAIIQLSHNKTGDDDCDVIVQKDIETIKLLPSAQPGRLTDDDFETIRIHLNAYKEKLGNQQRWKEAEEYQRIIERFMAFASAQSEITDEQAIEHLQSTGWMQNHDKQMYEMGLREQLADDSGSYDSLLLSAQPTPCDVCRYNPPSSMDGKPCCVCPAERRTDE